MLRIVKWYKQYREQHESEDERTKEFRRNALKAAYKTGKIEGYTRGKLDGRKEVWDYIKKES